MKSLSKDNTSTAKTSETAGVVERPIADNHGSVLSGEATQRADAGATASQTITPIHVNSALTYKTQREMKRQKNTVERLRFRELFTLPDAEIKRRMKQEERLQDQDWVVHLESLDLDNDSQASDTEVDETKMQKRMDQVLNMRQRVILDNYNAGAQLASYVGAANPYRQTAAAAVAQYEKYVVDNCKLKMSSKIRKKMIGLYAIAMACILNAVVKGEDRPEVKDWAELADRLNIGAPESQKFHHNILRTSVMKAVMQGTTEAGSQKRDDLTVDSRVVTEGTDVMLSDDSIFAEPVADIFDESVQIGLTSLLNEHFDSPTTEEDMKVHVRYRRTALAEFLKLATLHGNIDLQCGWMSNVTNRPQICKVIMTTPRYRMIAAHVLKGIHVICKSLKDEGGMDMFESLSHYACLTIIRYIHNSYKHLETPIACDGWVIALLILWTQNLMALNKQNNAKLPNLQGFLGDAVLRPEQMLKLIKLLSPTAQWIDLRALYHIDSSRLTYVSKEIFDLMQHKEIITMATDLRINSYNFPMKWKLRVLPESEWPKDWPKIQLAGQCFDPVVKRIKLIREEYHAINIELSNQELISLLFGHYDNLAHKNLPADIARFGEKLILAECLGQDWVSLIINTPDASIQVSGLTSDSSPPLNPNLPSTSKTGAIPKTPKPAAKKVKKKVPPGTIATESPFLTEMLESRKAEFAAQLEEVDRRLRRKQPAPQTQEPTQEQTEAETSAGSAALPSQPTESSLPLEEEYFSAEHSEGVEVPEHPPPPPPGGDESPGTSTEGEEGTNDDTKVREYMDPLLRRERVLNPRRKIGKRSVAGGVANADIILVRNEDDAVVSNLWANIVPLLRNNDNRIFYEEGDMVIQADLQGPVQQMNNLRRRRVRSTFNRFIPRNTRVVVTNVRYTAPIAARDNQLANDSPYFQGMVVAARTIAQNAYVPLHSTRQWCETIMGGFARQFHDYDNTALYQAGFMIMEMLRDFERQGEVAVFDNRVNDAIMFINMRAADENARNAATNDFNNAVAEARIWVCHWEVTAQQLSCMELISSGTQIIRTQNDSDLQHIATNINMPVIRWMVTHDRAQVPHAWVPPTAAAMRDLLRFLAFRRNEQDYYVRGWAQAQNIINGKVFPVEIRGQPAARYFTCTLEFGTIRINGPADIHPLYRVLNLMPARRAFDPYAGDYEYLNVATLDQMSLVGVFLAVANHYGITTFLLLYNINARDLNSNYCVDLRGRAAVAVIQHVNNAQPGEQCAIFRYVAGYMGQISQLVMNRRYFPMRAWNDGYQALYEIDEEDVEYFRLIHDEHLPIIIDHLSASWVFTAWPNTLGIWQPPVNFNVHEELNRQAVMNRRDWRPFQGDAGYMAQAIGAVPHAFRPYIIHALNAVLQHVRREDVWQIHAMLVQAGARNVWPDGEVEIAQPEYDDELHMVKFGTIRNYDWRLMGTIYHEIRYENLDANDLASIEAGQVNSQVAGINLPDNYRANAVNFQIDALEAQFAAMYPHAVQARPREPAAPPPPPPVEAVPVQQVDETALAVEILQGNEDGHA